jgi:hypothetical protein
MHWTSRSKSLLHIMVISFSVGVMPVLTPQLVRRLAWRAFIPRTRSTAGHVAVFGCIPGCCEAAKSGQVRRPEACPLLVGKNAKGSAGLNSSEAVPE